MARISLLVIKWVLENVACISLEHGLILNNMTGLPAAWHHCQLPLQGQGLYHRAPGMANSSAALWRQASSEEVQVSEQPHSAVLSLPVTHQLEGGVNKGRGRPGGLSFLLLECKHLDWRSLLPTPSHISVSRIATKLFFSIHVKAGCIH